ncbi:hypothetical protein [Providencia alcalifaciens]|uniref:hypothetical protein n=1 Tax=Providencia alcalifaciens TaxID=126385 RepID=UPI001CC5F8F1|nr:hypothetical protein NVI2019_GHJFPKLH_01389 [Providencia alcalifaciens]
MSEIEKLRSKILNNNWLQGSVIDCYTLKEAAAKITDSNIDDFILGIEEREQYCVVVISMSCDVVYGNCDALPNVECYISPVKNGTARNENIADPRRMVLNHNGKKLELDMAKKISIDRRILAIVGPDSQLAGNAINSIIRWTVSQYNRLGLPESLVRRIGNILRDKDFCRWLSENSNVIEGIFIELPTLKELDDEEVYEIGFVCLADCSGQEAIELDELEKEFYDVFLTKLDKIETIKLLNHTDYSDQDISAVIATDDFTYDMLKRFRRYHLDHYSLDSGKNENLVVA